MMEIKGENFIKNVQLKQEKEELQSKINEIDTNLDTPTVSTYKYDQDIEQAENELDDIMLGAKTSTPAAQPNKKKYIVLGLALIVLFLITIVLFRVLTSKSNDDESSFVEKPEEIKQEKALNDDNIEKQYQKIINQKLKNIKDQKTEAEQKASNATLDLKSIEKEEKKIKLPLPDPKEVKKAKELKEDIFDIKNGKKIVQPKKVQPKIEPLKVAPKKEIDKILAPAKETKKPTPVKITKPVKKEQAVLAKTEPKVEKKPVQKAISKASVTTTKPQGTFVQIGAFSKPISQKYLDTISSKGLEYKLYKVKIKDKLYTKVLIGPYRNKAHAQTQMPQIKQKLQINSAFVLSF